MRRGGSIFALALTLLGLGASGAGAQDGRASDGGAPDDLPATLIADSVSYDRETRRLTATGDVEVLYQGRVLRARAITYDQAADRIEATGPISLTDPATGVLLAGGAALTPDLRDGLIESAQVLIGEKLQIAAAEARRSEGRFTTLYRTVASSCEICAGSHTPTWSIRASRVTRDEVAQRIYFENATLQLLGWPVAWLPRMSVPDPGVNRASGVLVPMAQHSNIYGFGVKVPYFRVLGPTSDATLTPFLTTTGAKLLEGEYRRRFDSGGFDFNGVFALDDGLDGEFGRGAAFATGAFALPDFGLGAGFTTDFNLAVASDDAFLQQFDYSDADLLTSYARITRTRTSDYFELGSVAFQSLREDQASTTLPIVPLDFVYRELLAPRGLGGQLALEAQGLGILRADGQDTLRLGGDVDWRRGWTLPWGILASAGALGDFDVYRVWDDPTLPDSAVVRAEPNVNVELRWPFARAVATPAGVVSHVIEPIAQVIYSDTIGESDVPNNDSTLVEFDTTNLFSIDRFPGEDRVETGLRANLGIGYTRYDPAGWSLGATVGQVIRAEPDDEFYESTGLAGKWSDVVAALRLDIGEALSLVDRALFDTDLTFSRNEFTMAYVGATAGVRASYVFLAESDNPYYGPQPETNEFGIDARYRVLPNWEVRGLWRYDVTARDNLRAGGGVIYGNDCAQFDLSVSRRYTSSTNVPPSTSIGFSVRLAGLGGGSEGDWPAARVCAAQPS
ncbi:LPS-assembly protein LptD [Amaricoccus solimangrovi]|uniref:LPS-assembly protein LptD n=1 Tax=Amaricoccus solimangrovi TaxID=2589815 RepID=UPI0015E3C02C|nr:LPS assembly protein LptD [Amaricoccus solimangrovi]